MKEHVALVVEDRPEILAQVEEILGSLGHRCLHAETQEEAEAQLDSGGFCYVLLDLELPVRANRVPRVQTGYNLLERIRSEHTVEELAVIVMTAHGTDHSYATRAFKAGATDFIKKPFDAETESIEDKIHEALEKTCERLHDGCPHVTAAEAPVRARGGSTRAGRARKGGGAKRVTKGTKRRPIFRIVGFLKDRRYLIEVNGEAVTLRGSSLEVLCCLVGALLHQEQPGWLNGGALGSSPYNAIYRLRQDLGATIDRAVITGDGHGKYRLSTPPENVEITDSMRQDNPRLTKILDGS